jgi:hypothetical protein
MADVSNVVEVVSKRAPWNKGKIVGAKPPLRPRLASPQRLSVATGCPGGVTAVETSNWGCAPDQRMVGPSRSTRRVRACEAPIASAWSKSAWIGFGET